MYQKRVYILHQPQFIFPHNPASSIGALFGSDVPTPIMAPSSSYSLADVLAVANIHPFYSDAQYPPDVETIQRLREQASLSRTPPDLNGQPPISKKEL